MKKIIVTLKEAWHTNKSELLKITLIYATIILLSEMFLRRSIGSTLSWVINTPFLFALNLTLLLCVTAVLMMITKRTFLITAIVGGGSAALSVINIMKFNLRNIPLVVDDLFLISEVWVLLPEIFNLKTIILSGIGICGLILLGYLAKRFLKMKQMQKQMGLALILFSLSGMLLFVGGITYTSDLELSKTGFLYSLTNDLRAKNVIDSEQLNTAQALSEQLIAQYQIEDKDENFQPNVIIIQSEAFWDINKLGLKFSQNPIANFEALRAESLYGEAYVPVFGGGTANTEYELLTGLSLKNYGNDWFTVYKNEIKSPTVSLASIFRSQGYYALGIHPYMSWYYNRLEVYKHFGFNTFMPIEFMNQPDILGAYVSDAYTTDLIIDAIEETEAPLFSFVVTMQNHGPYGNHRFNADEIDVTIEDEVSHPNSYFLRNYTQGLYLSDLELKRLVDYLSASDEPTLLLFFGDHLPMLGEDYATYRELNYVGNETNEALQRDLRTTTVPYILWANYDQTSEALPTMNISYLTSLVLEKAGAVIPDYLKVLWSMHDQVPVYFRFSGIDLEGNVLTDEDQRFKDIKALQYLYYSELKANAATDRWIIRNNETYNESLKTIEILSLSNNQSVQGKGFYSGMEVSVSGQSMSFVFMDTENIMLERVIESGDVIKMTLKDQNGLVLSESQEFLVP